MTKCLSLVCIYTHTHYTLYIHTIYTEWLIYLELEIWIKKWLYTEDKHVSHNDFISYINHTFLSKNDPMFSWKVSVFLGNIDVLEYKLDHSSMYHLYAGKFKNLQTQTYVFVKTLRKLSRIFLVLTPYMIGFIMGGIRR